MHQCRKGFTIIAVLVAAFVIGVAITGLVIGFSNSLTMVEEIREISTADRIAQETMEKLRGGIKMEEIPGTKVVGEVTYTVSVSSSAVEEALTEVTVTVEWESHTGKTLSRSLVTYFTEHGITKD